MAIQYYLKRRGGKNTNNRYYPRVLRNGEVGTRELAGLIQKRCSATRGDVELVLTNLVEVMTQELHNGRTVRLDGLGRFYVNLLSGGVDNPDDWSAGRDIRSLHILFLPTGQRIGQKRRVKREMTDGVTLRRVEAAEKPGTDNDGDMTAE